MKPPYSIFKWLLLTFSFILAQLHGFSQVNLDSVLVGFYPFIAGAADSSGNNNHGTLLG